MNFDELKECTRCGSDACYRQEVTKDISIEMCYGCGFQSNSLMKKGNEFFNDQSETLPELYKALMDEEEETGKVWMPSTINVEDKGMVFADGNNKDNWKWGAVKAVNLTNEEIESKRYPEDQTVKMDMANIQHFDSEKGFMDALEVIGFYED